MESLLVAVPFQGADREAQERDISSFATLQCWGSARPHTLLGKAACSLGLSQHARHRCDRRRLVASWIRPRRVCVREHSVLRTGHLLQRNACTAAPPQQIERDSVLAGAESGRRADVESMSPSADRGLARSTRARSTEYILPFITEWDECGKALTHSHSCRWEEVRATPSLFIGPALAPCVFLPIVTSAAVAPTLNRDIQGQWKVAGANREQSGCRWAPPAALPS